MQQKADNLSLIGCFVAYCPLKKQVKIRYNNIVGRIKVKSQAVEKAPDARIERGALNAEALL